MALKTKMIHARIEPALKQSVEDILEGLGLTPTEAIRLFYRQVELRRGLPFAVEIPNTETADTLMKADSGKDLHQAKDAQELFDKLGI